MNSNNYIRPRQSYSSMGACVRMFLESENQERYLTYYASGFKQLDKLMGGGFTAGLHCIGAVSSYGKTTYLLQIAENQARQNQPVIIFSLEANSLVLAAKAVSRQTFLMSGKDSGLATTANHLLNQSCMKACGRKEQELVKRAASEVSAYCDYITIVENDTTPFTASRITACIKHYVEEYRVKPVVMIDYLQAVAVSASRYSEKQKVDSVLEQLRAVAGYFDIPIIILSSFNRENYDMPVSFKSFKDSGSIEYTCDTLMGFQMRDVGRPQFSSGEALAKNPREMELCILKQRNGNTGTIPYLYFAEYNLFEEAQGGRAAHTESAGNSIKRMF